MALAVWQSTIVNRSGDVQPNAQVEVRLESSGALAAIYADRDGTTPLSNPFNADENGFARFYAAGGAYRIDATLGGSTTTYRHQSVGLLAEQDVVTESQLHFSLEGNETDVGLTASDIDTRFSIEYIKVKRYKAVADGNSANAEADTTAAENALLVAAKYGGARVVFEHGNFMIKRPLVPDGNKIELIGDGATLTATSDIPAGGAIICSLTGGSDATANQSILDGIYGASVVSPRTNLSGSMTWARIRGFRFVANSAAIKGIHVTGWTVGCSIDDNIFSNFEDASIAMNGCWSFSLSRNDVRGRNGNGVGIELAKSGNGVNSSQVQCNGFSLRSNHCTSLGAIGLRVGESLGGDIGGNIFESTTSGFLGCVLLDCEGVHYHGNYHEVSGSGAYALVLGAADNSVKVIGSAIVGNKFQMSTGSSAAILLNALNLCDIGPNQHGGPVTQQYATPASYAANQMVSNRIHIIRDNSTYISETATLDRVSNRMFESLTYSSTDRSANQERFSRVRCQGLYFNEVTPAQLTADADNYEPDVNASYLRLSSDAARTITGLPCPSLDPQQNAGRRLTIVNVGSHGITLAHQSASSSAQRRIICPGAVDITLASFDYADLIYDGTTGRWRVLGHNGS